MAKVVITDQLMASGIKILEDAGHQVTQVDASLKPREELLARLGGADALCTSLIDRVDAEFLDAAGPQVKIVANVAVGFNNIDLAECAARGIVVTNTPDVLTDSCADLTIGLMLMVTRRLGEAERFVRAGNPWKYAMTMMIGSSLAGKDFGLIGAGRIGRAVAKRARVFGMHIIYSGNHPMEAEDERVLDAEFVPLDELLSRAHVVSLHCPYTPATHHLLGDKQFAMMTPGSYLLNTARGLVVDEDAMIRALDSGQLAGVGLDVYANEPHIPETLMTRENVVLLPHIASATRETRSIMSDLAATNVVEVLAGREAVTRVIAK